MIGKMLALFCVCCGAITAAKWLKSLIGALNYAAWKHVMLRKHANETHKSLRWWCAAKWFVLNVCDRLWGLESGTIETRIGNWRYRPPFRLWREEQQPDRPGTSGVCE